ncbi:MAG: hypothetical protein JXL81_07655 [Deltaproteobacteria bacterium]|nr:hypothetical protein [Deltaproteobacteria bacterium]
MRALIFTVLFMLVAGFAYAADIDGKWNGEVAGMGGGEPMKISYTFKADGNTLTGNTKGMDGNDLAIKDGKIDGNKFSYSLDFGMGQPMKFNGEVKGDTIELKMEMGDMGGGGGGGMPEMPPIVLKKEK